MCLMHRCLLDVIGPVIGGGYGRAGRFRCPASAGSALTGVAGGVNVRLPRMSGEVLGGELRAGLPPVAGMAGRCVFGFPVDAGAAPRLGQRFCGKFAGCVVESDRPEHEFGVADVEVVQDPFDIAGTWRSETPAVGVAGVNGVLVCWRGCAGGWLAATGRAHRVRRVRRWP